MAKIGGSPPSHNPDVTPYNPNDSVGIVFSMNLVWVFLGFHLVKVIDNR